MEITLIFATDICCPTSAVLFLNSRTLPRFTKSCLP